MITMSLETISGFNELDSVGGNINITNNSLKTFSSFNKLRKVGGHASFFVNNKMTTLSVFSALTSIGENLRIVGHRNLMTVSGFDVLKHVGGDVLIGINGLENYALTTIPSFKALTSVGGDLKVAGNSVLPTLSGFSALESVGGDLDIVGNGSLPTVSGLFCTRECGRGLGYRVKCFARDRFWFWRRFMSVGGVLRFFANDVLTALPSFSALTKVGGELRITRNSKLSSCCGIFPFVSGTLAPGGGTTINGNTGGCNSVSAIKANCTAVRTLRVLSTDLTATSAAGRAIFDVAANVPWKITKKVTDTWISSITPKTGNGNQQITIEYGENTDPVQREATFTLAATDVGATETTDITLTQAGATPTPPSPSSPSSPPVLGLPTLAQHLHFYPNPTSNSFVVENDAQSARISIQHVHGGRLMSVGVQRGRNEVDISHLPSGAYVVTLTTPQGSVSRRLIKAE